MASNQKKCKKSEDIHKCNDCVLCKSYNKTVSAVDLPSTAKAAAVDIAINSHKDIPRRWDLLRSLLKKDL